MRYISTRGAAPPKRFTEILLEGLAADGGLYVPEVLPQVRLRELRGLDYRSLAHAILSIFMDDVPDLGEIVHRTYSPKVFGSADVTPLRTLEPGLHLLGLSQRADARVQGHRDAAARRAVRAGAGAEKRHPQHPWAPPRATPARPPSTRCAASAGIRVFMLSPHKRMSAFQSAQMYSLQDANIHNLAVSGVFDDCQDVVKKVNADAAYKAQHRIGAVNSINWARVAAQVVYYFKGYFAATRDDREQVSFAVPSGNFGNIYAGTRRAAAWACRSAG